MVPALVRTLLSHHICDPDHWQLFELHFQVLECDEFYSLGAEQVAQLIASDTITVPSEERVFESVIGWINHDVDTRCDLTVLQVFLWVKKFWTQHFLVR